MKKGMIIKAAALIAASTMLFSACGAKGGAKAGADAAASTVVPDTITAQVAYAGRDFNPATTSMALPMGGNWHVTEGLYTMQMTDFSFVDGLAAGDPTQVSDTEYTVKIRKDAKFSDGNPVTPNDVKTSFERMMKEGNIYAPMLSFIQSVEPAGEDGVTFKLKKPFKLLKERLALVHIVPASQTDEQLQKMPIGSGPWKYVEITDQKVTFDANEHYNGKFPAQTKHMVWNVNVDDTARVTAMQSGKNDVMENVPAKAFKTLEAAGSEISTVSGFNQAFILFNTKQDPFDKKEVRQAVLYGIDADSLIKNQLQGEADPVTGFLPKSFKDYHEAKNIYKYDVEKAKKMLADAGVQPGVKFTLYTTDHSWITQLAPQIKNNLADLGFNVDIQSMKSAALWPTVADADDAKYSMVLAPGDPTVFGNDPDVLLNWWFGDSVWTHKRTRWFGTDGYNKLHELMDKATSVDAGPERTEYWNEAMDIISDEVPLYPLFHRHLSTAVRKGVFKDYKSIGTPGLYFLNTQLSKKN